MNDLVNDYLIKNFEHPVITLGIFLGKAIKKEETTQYECGYISSFPWESLDDYRRVDLVDQLIYQLSLGLDCLSRGKLWLFDIHPNNVGYLIIDDKVVFFITDFNLVLPYRNYDDQYMLRNKLFSSWVTPPEVEDQGIYSAKGMTYSIAKTAIFSLTNQTDFDFDSVNTWLSEFEAEPNSTPGLVANRLRNMFTDFSSRWTIKEVLNSYNMIEDNLCHCPMKVHSLDISRVTNHQIRQLIEGLLPMNLTYPEIGLAILSGLICLNNGMDLDKLLPGVSYLAKFWYLTGKNETIQQSLALEVYRFMGDVIPYNFIYNDSYNTYQIKQLLKWGITSTELFRNFIEGGCTYPEDEDTSARDYTKLARID